MKRLHPDSDTIDRIGILTIRERFGISRQAVHYWRRAGVPNEHRGKLLALARRLNVDATSLKSTCGRKKGRPLTSGRVSASSATPA